MVLFSAQIGRTVVTFLGTDKVSHGGAKAVLRFWSFLIGCPVNVKELQDSVLPGPGS